MAFLPIGKTIFSSLFKKASTLAYPFAPIERAPIVRGHIHNDVNQCIFCGLCMRNCPTKSIAVDRPNKTWEIFPFKCILCGRCTEVCPKKCLHMLTELTPSSGVQTTTTRIPDPVPENAPIEAAAKPPVKTPEKVLEKVPDA